MNREEELIRASKECMQTASDLAFLDGAQWADENPSSRYNISDTDFVREALECIIASTERMTSGNVSHNRASIISMARSAMDMFKPKEENRRSHLTDL